jgi:hypothetical protein
MQSVTDSDVLHKEEGLRGEGDSFWMTLASEPVTIPAGKASLR